MTNAMVDPSTPHKLLLAHSWIMVLTSSQCSSKQRKHHQQHSSPHRQHQRKNCGAVRQAAVSPFEEFTGYNFFSSKNTITTSATLRGRRLQQNGDQSSLAKLKAKSLWDSAAHHRQGHSGGSFCGVVPDEIFVSNDSEELPFVISIQDRDDDAASELSLEDGLFHSNNIHDSTSSSQDSPFPVHPPPPPLSKHHRDASFLLKSNPLYYEQVKASPFVHYDPTWGITLTTLNDGLVEWPSDEEEGEEREQELPDKPTLRTPPPAAATVSDNNKPTEATKLVMCAESFYGCSGLQFWSQGRFQQQEQKRATQQREGYNNPPHHEQQQQQQQQQLREGSPAWNSSYEEFSIARPSGSYHSVALP